MDLCEIKWKSLNKIQTQLGDYKVIILKFNSFAGLGQTQIVI